MKKLLYILSIIFLSAPAAFAQVEEPRETEFTALFSTPAWEREADARIWSNRVVRDFKSGSSAGFRINALCDESAINEIERIRKISLDIIKSDIDSGRGSSSKGALALEIFERADEYIPASDEVDERADIALFKTLPLGENSNTPADIAGTGNPEIPVIQYGFSAGVTISTGSPQLKKHGSDSGRVKASYFICISPLNLSLLWDREKSDSYRIFLYIRDDDRIKDLSANIIFPPSSVSLRHLHFPNSNTGTEFLHITELNNTINAKRHTVERYVFTAYTQTVPQSTPHNYSIYTSGAVI